MNKSAQNYNAQGVELASNDRLEVAIDFFTKAIDEDPDFLEAYKNRGEALIKLNRVDEGEKDLQKAAGRKKKPVKIIQQQKKVVQKYNLDGVEDLWGSVLSDERPDNDDDLFLDDLLSGGDYSTAASGSEQGVEAYDDDLYEDEDIPYDDIHPDGSIEDVTAFDAVDDQFASDDNFADEIAATDAAGDEQFDDDSPLVSPVTEDCSAILEYVGGLRQEVVHARLFEPLENSLLIIDEETNDEQVIFFDQLTCLRVSSLPARIAGKRKRSCIREIIETVDGKIYHELVHPEQDMDNFLICFSPDDQTGYPVTLISKSIIQQRTQDRWLTDILLEKRFISKVIVQKVLQEFAQIKSMTFEKIIAQKARISLAEIEEALDQAKRNQMLGLQIGEILLISGVVNEEQVLDAVEHLEYIDRLTIEQFLVEKGVVQEREVYSALAEMHKIPFVDLIGRKFSQKVFSSLPESMIARHEILPLVMKDDTVLVAASLVDMTPLREAIVQAAACKDVKFVLSPPSQIKKIINLLSAHKK